MLIKTKQNPIEYKSLLLNSIAGFLNSLFKKYLGSIADPIKNAINAIANRGNIASFTKAFVVACERLSDFTQREIYDALDKFKDKKMLNSVLVKLK